MELRSKRTGLGQVQWWFAARLTDERALPSLPAGEFTDREWVSWDEAIERAASFKRPVYAELARAFAQAESP